MTLQKELLIEICKKCYLDCRFCSSNADEKTLYCLDFDQIKSIINDTNKLNIDNIEISGGEPIVHPDFLKICEYLKANNKKILLYTSGNIKNKENLVQIPNKILKRLKELEIDAIRFNLQSHDPLIHNFLTNTSSFENTLSSLETSIKLGLNTEIHIIPLKQNYKKLSETIQFFKQIGVSKIKFLRFVAHGRGLLNRRSLELNQRQNFELLGQFIKFKQFYGNLIEVGSSFNNSIISKEIKICRECNLGKNKTAITSDGKVYPCVSTKNFGYFNFELDNQPLHTILYSKDYLDRLKSYLSITLNSAEVNKYSYSLCPTQKYLEIKSAY